jgi:hypothetical protein
MTDEPIDLDEHRGMAAQRATDIRRRSGKVAADQAELRRRQEEIEQSLLAAPSATWPEAAEKGRLSDRAFHRNPGRPGSATP